MSRARKRAYRDGVMAETLAAWLYRFEGYRIVALRYHSMVFDVVLCAPWALPRHVEKAFPV